MKKLVIGLSVLCVASITVFAFTSTVYTGTNADAEVIKANPAVITTSTEKPACCEDKEMAKAVAANQDGCPISKSEAVAARGSCPFTGSTASVQTVSTNDAVKKSGHCASKSEAVAAKAECDGKKDCDKTKTERVEKVAAAN